MTQYTKHLPVALYRAEQVKELDRMTIEEKGVLGFTLMTKAAQATFTLIQSKLLAHRKCNGANDQPLTVFCGAGNNGGDGYVLASLAKQAGLPVVVVQLADASKITGDALLAYEQAVSCEVEIIPFHLMRDDLLTYGIIVDALLGTGLKGEVSGDYCNAIERINASSLPVCAVDIPSGLCANTGSVLGCAVSADVTVSYIGLKQGLLTGNGPEQCGDVYFAKLDVPDDVFQQVKSSSTRVTPSLVTQYLGRRNRVSHKGDFGHVVVIGGDVGMGGAAIMASEAASFVGAGMVTVLTRGEHVAPLLARHPECMVLDADKHVCAIDEILAKATVIVAGPGIGKGAWAENLLSKALATDIPLVLDADGLNFLSSSAGEKYRQRGSWVLTPHPGEAARLLQCADSTISIADIAKDRFLHAQKISQQYNAIVVLKGAGTLIATPQLDAANAPSIALANVGNPGMATAGMGDVLSGVVGGLLAQHLSLTQAAQVGVWLHGKAADCVVKDSGERGLKATDLLPTLRRLANGVQKLCQH